MTLEEQYEALCRRHDELVNEYADADAERGERILEDIAVHELIILNHPARPIEEDPFPE